MIFDSHAHYDSHQFDDDREDMLSNLLPKSNVIGIINCASDFKSAEMTVKLCEQYDYIYGAVGVHPHETEEAGAFDEDRLIALVNNKKIVAVGEIGLDYHYDFSPKDIQKEWFEKQIILANELDLPVIVHDREAHKDTMDILTKYKPKGVVHCFSGSVETARETINLGMYIGLGGAVTFKNAKTPVEVAKDIPLERLLLETDAPYMTPVPHRGKRCDSSYIIYTAEKIAEVRGIETEQVLKAACDNAKRLFGI